MPDYTATNFKIGACAATFNSVALGGTEGNINLKHEPIYHESKCDQGAEQVLRKIIRGFKTIVTVPMKEIDTAFVQLLDASSKVTTAEIGSDILDDGAELALVPIDSNDTKSFSFPNAVLLKDFDYTPDGSKDHVLTLTFEIYPDDTGVILEQTTIGV